MCGIAGCVAPAAEAPDRQALQRMADALVHRGPDDGGIAVEGGVGLVNRRLAIVDPTPAVARPLQLSGLWHRFPIEEGAAGGGAQ